ncbi:VOC family protein [Nakamurella sp. YIM 132087]|uniref:VOC family protein n=1 Tax=Nakamurella alba TaxID=2665158 RepID=A0A7K1FEY7_9ACTN|nr:VOC family protein [Nakamurella alba]MTD12636.1 VOC family protein [Nakamurella alba]
MTASEKSEKATTTAKAGPATPTLAMFTIDCADPGPTATFYAELLGLTVSYQDDDAVMLAGESGPALGFGRVEGHRPPAWPDPDGGKQFHLDLNVADIPAATARALELGATEPEFQPGEGKWTVLLDPAGHPFCLATWPS